jgi:hypothetical protein
VERRTSLKFGFTCLDVSPEDCLWGFTRSVHSLAAKNDEDEIALSRTCKTEGIKALVDWLVPAYARAVDLVFSERHASRHRPWGGVLIVAPDKPTILKPKERTLEATGKQHEDRFKPTLVH